MQGRREAWWGSPVEWGKVQRAGSLGGCTACVGGGEPSRRRQQACMHTAAGGCPPYLGEGTETSSVTMTVVLEGC